MSAFSDRWLRVSDGFGLRVLKLQAFASSELLQRRRSSGTPGIPRDYDRVLEVLTREGLGNILKTIPSPVRLWFRP